MVLNCSEVRDANVLAKQPSDIQTKISVYRSRFVLKSTLLLFSLVLVTLPATYAVGEDFRILAWNVESNRPNQAPVSDLETISGQLKELCQAAETRPSLVALSEVEPRSFESLQKSVSAPPVIRRKQPSA